MLWTFHLLMQLYSLPVNVFLLFFKIVCWNLNNYTWIKIDSDTYTTALLVLPNLLTVVEEHCWGITLFTLLGILAFFTRLLPSSSELSFESRTSLIRGLCPACPCRRITFLSSFLRCLSSIAKNTNRNKSKLKRQNFWWKKSNVSCNWHDVSCEHWLLTQKAFAHPDCALLPSSSPWQNDGRLDETDETPSSLFTNDFWDTSKEIKYECNSKTLADKRVMKCQKFYEIWSMEVTEREFQKKF